MSLSKRSGVYYLWYLDSRGWRQKISIRSATKSGALAFLWKFKPKELVTTTANPIEPRMKISDLSGEYQAHSATIQTKHTQRCYNDCLDQFFEAVGDKELLRVSVREVERFLEKSGQRCLPGLQDGVT